MARTCVVQTLPASPLAVSTCAFHLCRPASSVRRPFRWLALAAGLYLCLGSDGSRRVVRRQHAAVAGSRNGKGEQKNEARKVGVGLTILVKRDNILKRRVRGPAGRAFGDRELLRADVSG